MLKEPGPSAEFPPAKKWTTVVGRLPTSQKLPLTASPVLHAYSNSTPITLPTLYSPPLSLRPLPLIQGQSLHHQLQIVSDKGGRRAPSSSLCAAGVLFVLFGHRRVWSHTCLAFWRHFARLCAALDSARRVVFDADPSPLLRCRRLDAQRFHQTQGSF